MTEETKEVLRTRWDGTYEIFNSRWGKYIVRCVDPLADSIITEDNLNHFEPNKNANRIPSDIWTAWISLCFHYVDKIPNEMEVEVRFLASESDPSQYMAIVPEQYVTKAAVRAPNFDKCCNLLTGEKYTSYPPVGWFPCGSSHSHNTMKAYFSSVDDTSELNDPGIHLTIGEIDTEKRTYQIAASVVGNKRRFRVNYKYLIDTEPDETSNFHPNVLEYIDYTSESTNQLESSWTNYQKKLPPSRNTSGYRNWRRSQLHSKAFDDYLERIINPDPFYYDDNGTTFYNFEKGYANSLNVIEELLKEHMNFIQNDTDALEEFKNTLSSFLIDIEQTISS